MVGAVTNPRPHDRLHHHRTAQPGRGLPVPHRPPRQCPAGPRAHREAREEVAV
ncbi:hypothetical protein LV779_19495 [Streptomyces thinghirensis]|nr:hypothetical protein [Streptomyces thinghirensis]